MQFSDGLTEELIATMSKIRGLGIIPRTSVMKYKGATKPIHGIGRDIEVGYVLEGSPRKAGSKVRINVQLVNGETKEHLWSGSDLLNSRTEEGLTSAIEHFQKSLREESEYSLAYTGLADAYAVRALLEFVPPKDAFPNSREAARKALRIDKNLAEAHTSLGLVLFQYDWDWEKAEREFRESIEPNPNYAAAHQF